MSDLDDLKSDAQQEDYERSSGRRNGPTCRECGYPDNACQCDPIELTNYKLDHSAELEAEDLD
jgi:hypothetical protein